MSGQFKQTSFLVLLLVNYFLMLLFFYGDRLLPYQKEDFLWLMPFLPLGYALVTGLFFVCRKNLLTWLRVAYYLYSILVIFFLFELMLLN